MWDSEVRQDLRNHSKEVGFYIFNGVRFVRGSKAGARKSKGVNYIFKRILWSRSSLMVTFQTGMSGPWKVHGDSKWYLDIQNFQGISF